VPVSASAAALLSAAAGRLYARVRRWSPVRWTAVAPGGRTRADVVFDLVQRLADAAADAEHRPRRGVPRLEHDLAIPDQVRVMVADLLASGAPADSLVRAATAIDTTARAI
jgi:hypothetical protein